MASRVVFDEAALFELFRSVDGPVGKAVTRASVKVHRRAKHLSPVDTGRLRASIAYEIGKDGRGIVGRVGTNVNYARHVEFGTGRMRAQPFLRPALSAARGGA